MMSKSRWIDQSDTVMSAFASPKEAEDTTERLLEERFEAGRQAGEQAAREQLAAELEAQSLQVERAIRESTETFAAWRKETEKQLAELITELSLEVAERIVREKIAQGDPIATAALTEALEKIQSLPIVDIRSHPEDLASLQAIELPQRSAGELNWIADESLERGSCIVRTECGDIDLTIRTQLQLAASALRGQVS